MTPREAFGLMKYLHPQKIHETGERITLAGGKGEDFVRRNLGKATQKQAQKLGDEFEEFSRREIERLTQEAQARGKRE